MNSWKSDDEYWKISYVTHDKKPVKGICSVRKGTINVKELYAIHHGNLPSNSGD